MGYFLCLGKPKIRANTALLFSFEVALDQYKNLPYSRKFNSEVGKS